MRICDGPYHWQLYSLLYVARECSYDTASAYFATFTAIRCCYFQTAEESIHASTVTSERAQLTRIQKVEWLESYQGSVLVPFNRSRALRMLPAGSDESVHLSRPCHIYSIRVYQKLSTESYGATEREQGLICTVRVGSL